MFCRVRCLTAVLVLAPLTFSSGCSNYDARVAQRVEQLKSGTAVIAGPALTIDPKLAPSALDVADKSGASAGIRINLPKYFFNDANAVAFTSLAPADTSPAAAKRTRGAATGMPAENVMITYETPQTSIVFAQFALGQPPALETYFDGKTAVTPTDFTTLQGTWKRYEYSGLFEQSVNDQVAAADGAYIMYRLTSKTREVVIGFFAPRNQADAVVLREVADASIRTVVLAEGR